MRGVRVVAVLLVGVAAIGGSLLYRSSLQEDRKTYKIEHEPLAGWQREFGTPTARFLYRRPAIRSMITGATTIAPDDDEALLGPTGNISRHIGPLTEGIEASNAHFKLHRKPNGRSVIAIGTKGRTTLLVTLSGESEAGVDAALPDLKKLVASVRFVPER